MILSVAKIDGVLIISKYDNKFSCIINHIEECYKYNIVGKEKPRDSLKPQTLH